MSSLSLDPLGQAGMTYFGRTTASISHELKNALAIIKENAGLMQDYLLMAEKGMPIDPEKFKMITDRIGAQTQRADNIIKNMNRFAHSADHPSVSTDLNELAELFIALSHREAAMRQVTLTVSRENAPAIVTTAPFILLTLLGRCLTYCLDAVDPANSIDIKVHCSDDDCGICFNQLYKISALTDKGFPGEQETILADALQASFSVDESCGTLLIKLA